MITTARPRILHVFGQLNRGGAEMRTLDVMRRLDPRRQACEFVCLSGLPGDLDDEVRRLGGRVHLCRLDWRFPRRFQQLLRQRRIDVVHSHVQLFSGLVLRWAARAGVATRIAHFRNVSSGRPASLRRRMQDGLMRHWLDRWATLILGNGESSLSYGWREDWADDPRCAVIHNGLDAAPFTAAVDPAAVRREFGWPADCRLGIHVGRMDPQKNHERLVEMVGWAARGDSELRFLLVGRETAQVGQRVRSRIAQLGLEDRVAIAGLRGDVPRLLKAADVLLFPSRWEGLPGAVLEACAAGTPVVASDLPSVLEIAGHLGGIHCLPLSAADAIWAQQVAAVARGAAPAKREAARRTLESSVYSIQLCTEAHRLAWSGASGTAIRARYGDRFGSREHAA